MSCLYKRPDSPYWWVKFTDASGKVRQESTGCRYASVAETRKARSVRAEKEIVEREAAPKERNERRLKIWVQPWISGRYAKQKHTLESYNIAWGHLLRFFTTKGVTGAEGVRREHCFEYLEVRQREGACRNTAIHDLVVLRVVLFEAVARGWIVANPASKLGLKKDAPTEKREFTDKEAEIIFAAKLPEWAQISWAIAWYQGCRLAETSLPLDDVDLKRGLITLTLKGGKRHTTRLHPKLNPLFTKLKKAKAQRTWEFTRNASRDWARIFKRLGFEGVGFHSTRVTAITKMARSGKVNEQQAMRFIGHASEQVHQIYQRLKTSDLDSCVEALS